MRKLFYIIAASLLFTLGWISHKLIQGEDTAAYHWKKLEQYKEHMADPNNRRDSIGFTHVTPPFDNHPHLEALVSLGELNKRHIIFPNVPVSEENTKDWMTFANHPDVLEASSQGSYYHGEVPLSFTLWYKPSFEEAVKAYEANLNKNG